MTRIFVILNPVAGHSDLPQFYQLVNDCVERHGCEYKVYETGPDDDLAQVARRAVAEGYEIVAAAGGDGTVSAVANALIQTDIPLGIIPVGTGNQLAREVSIPIEIKGALDLIAGEHSFRCIDVGRLKDRFLLLNVSVGLSPRMMQEADHETKQSFGFAAYLWIFFKELLGLHSLPFRLKIDDRPYRVWATELLVANAGGLGTAFVRWGSNIRIDDGQFNVCIVHAHTLWHYIKLAWDILFRNTERNPYIDIIPARQTISIRTARPMAVQADGEVIGQTPVDVEIMPSALKLIVPAEA